MHAQNRIELGPTFLTLLSLLTLAVRWFFYDHPAVLTARWRILIVVTLALGVFWLAILTAQGYRHVRKTVWNQVIYGVSGVLALLAI